MVAVPERLADLVVCPKVMPKTRVVTAWILRALPHRWKAYGLDV